MKSWLSSLGHFPFSYLPVSFLAGAKQYSINFTGDIIDVTNYPEACRNGGFRTKTYGMNDVSIELSRFYDLDKKFITKLNNRQKVLIYIIPHASEIIVGWFIPESDGLSGDISSLEEESLTFQLAIDDAADFVWT